MILAKQYLIPFLEEIDQKTQNMMKYEDFL
jgi:hypothetical protein